MKNRFGSNKHVNFGIALALVGILVFSLATSVEGFGLKEGITAPTKDEKAKDEKQPAKLPAKKATTDTKKAIEKALLKLQQNSKP